MPLYVADYRGAEPLARFERSPRIVLETDATSAAGLSGEIRAAADATSFGKIEALRTGRVPSGGDGVLTWFAGDSLMQGSSAHIRRDLRTAGRRCFIPVHLPCMAELDLIVLEPRWVSGGRGKDFWSSGARIARAGSLSAQATSALQSVNEHWAKLVQSLLADKARPGAGIEGLGRLARDTNCPPQIAALALRNLLALMARRGDLPQAEKVLEGAQELFPDYAELFYIGGILALHQNKVSQALWRLDRARTGNHEFVGSGGETSYRTGWLVGKVSAKAGQQSQAFENFYAGMMGRPVFTPAVDEILNMRLSPAMVEKHQYDFCRLVRQEPRYLKSVFEYLLLHRAFPAARRIAETMPLSENERDVLRQRLASAETPFRASRQRSGKAGIMLSGPVFEHSSLARINRELGSGLNRSSQFDVAIEPCCHPQVLPEAVTRGKELSAALLRHPKQLDLTIRHQWPPDFERPARGKLAVILPWEFGAVPRMWVNQIERNVDELWVPSQFVRDIFVRAGVSERRIQVIPNGFDAALLSPDGPSSRPRGCRHFLFLFVGGAIQRKGIDVLLAAYAEAFEAGDDVTLAVSTGKNPAYSHNSLDGLMKEFVGNPRLPHLAIISDQLDDTNLARLYRGCDAFVLPYRGEGFGMPLAEAMACGKPVITTADGPASEFCPADCAYFIPATESPVPDPLPPFGPFVGNWTWFEPDAAALARTMRHVYENREEAAEKGRKGAKAIRRGHAWEKVVDLYAKRVTALTERDSDTASTERMPADKTLAEAAKESACRESLCR